MYCSLSLLIVATIISASHNVGVLGAGIADMGIGRLGYSNGVGLGAVGIGGQVGMGMMGMPIDMVGMKLFGGGQMSGSLFDQANKGMNGHFVNNGFGNEGAGFNFGQSGLAKGGHVFKNSLGDMGYWNDAQGGKNMMQDHAGYHGGHVVGIQGANKASANADKGHKKGYTVKGFKTSHQSDEKSNTEEVYDEALDEAAKKAVKGEEGKYGENRKGEMEGKIADVKFDSKSGKAQGKYENDYMVGKNNAQMAGIAGNKYAGDSSFYGANNGGNLHDQAGHHESSKFSNHYPINY